MDRRTTVVRRDIGTMGTLYDGATQHALAIAGAPFVKAMIPVDAMSDFGRYGVRHNGAFELRLPQLGFHAGEHGRNRQAPLPPPAPPCDPAAVTELIEMGNHVSRICPRLPLRPGTTPLKFAPDYEAWLIEAMSMAIMTTSGRMPDSSVVDHLAEYKDIPVYHVTGWYDSWGTPVANMNYVELKKAKKSLQRLIIGPWTHGGRPAIMRARRNSPRMRRSISDALQDRWFEHWLKGRR